MCLRFRGAKIFLLKPMPLICVLDTRSSRVIPRQKYVYEHSEMVSTRKFESSPFGSTLVY